MASNRPIQGLGLHLIQDCQIGIQHDPFAANQANPALDSLYGSR